MTLTDALLQQSIFTLALICGSAWVIVQLAATVRDVWIAVRLAERRRARRELAERLQAVGAAYYRAGVVRGVQLGEARERERQGARGARKWLLVDGAHEGGRN